jgi:hypothetical protein
MLPPLVVFWLALPAGPGDARIELEQWAADRGYRPVAAAEAARPRYDDAVVHEIEALLEDARSLAPELPASFERLDQLLAAHPELPQSGWWAAERYLLEAQSRARGAERDLAAERELTQRASVLEGPRASGVSADATSAPVDSVRQEALQLEGMRRRDELLIDGRNAVAGTEIGPGFHHVQLFRSQRRVWAGWVELGSPPLLRLTDTTPPCTAADLWGTEQGARGPIAPHGVRCAAWAVANAHGTQIQLAFCRSDQCSAWERRSRAGIPSGGEQAAAAPRQVPAWVTWGAIGVGAAASTLLVLWQTGALDRPAPSTQFVFTGPTAAALRF